MKKIITNTLILIILSLLVLTGCNTVEPTTSLTNSPVIIAADDTVADLLPYTVTFNFGEQSATFSNADLASLTLIDFSVEVLDDNDVTTRYYKGIAFSEIFTLKSIISTGISSFSFTSVKPTPNASAFTQLDATHDPLSAYYFALFEKNDDGIYEVMNITVKDADNNNVSVSGIRNISTNQNYKTYWVKGVEKVDITYNEG